MKRLLLRFTGLYLLLVTIFTLLMVAVHLIPRSAIEPNVLSSSHQLIHEGSYPKKWGKTRLFMLDNFTDALMLNIAISADERHPVYSSMRNSYYTSNVWTDNPYDLEKVAKGEVSNLYFNDYGRYWHGSQVFLRPLLSIMDHSHIRKVNFVLFLFLAGYCLFLIWKKIGLIESILFLLALLRVNFPIVPYSLQFSACFYLMFLGTIAVLRFPSLTCRSINRLMTFFVIGAFAVFFDLLTTPQLTLCIPLMAMLLMTKSEKPVLKVVTSSISWSLGYVSVWAGKWIVCGLLTGHGIFDEALSSVKQRTSSAIGDVELSISYVWDKVIMMPEPVVWVLTIVLLTVIIVWKSRTSDGRTSLLHNNWLLLVASIVPMWFVLMPNHSIEHIFFTQRAFLIPLYAILIWVYRVVRKEPSAANHCPISPTEG